MNSKELQIFQIESSGVSSLQKKPSLLSKYSVVISRNTLANPNSSLSLKKVFYNVYICKNPLGLLVYYIVKYLYIIKTIK